MPNLPLSPKHGVNPAIPLCYFCNKSKNEVILAGRLPEDAEAPRAAVWDMRPCDECAGYMRQGIILISVRDGEPHSNNPHRTGGWAVVTEDAIIRWLTDGPTRATILVKRVAFIEDHTWTMLGLPRGT